MIKPKTKQSYKKFAISLCFAVLIFLFIISFSIAIPIYLRPVYYIYANTANLAEQTGFGHSEIKEAYDAVLDYLTLPGKEFSAGGLKYSEDGKAHFEDCKKLFSLNTSVLIISSAAIIATLLFSRNKKDISSLLRRGAAYAGFSAIALPLLIGTVVATNFDIAFTVFHKLFFPGKSNWIFNPSTDEIILILPQDFFMLCATLIGISVLFLSFAFVFFGLQASKKQQNKKQIFSR